MSEEYATESSSASTEALPPRTRRFAKAATLISVLGFAVLLLRKTFAVMDLFVTGGLTLQLAALLPMGVLLWSYRRIDQPRLGPQLSCRAVWWSSLVVGVLVAHNYGSAIDRASGVTIAVACGLALVLAGERGLDAQEPDHPFAPVRFRGHLLLALVMAAADALTLAFSGMLQLRLGSTGWNFAATLDYAGPTVLAGCVMALAVWGVFRLRTWALLLNLVANIAIAYLAMEGTLSLSPSVSLALATTAAIQCFIPVPILAAALGDRKAGQPLLARGRTVLMGGALCGLVALAFAGAIEGDADGWVDGPGRAFIRGPKLPPNLNDDAYVPERPRARLDALEDDLRGRSFADEDLTRADFRGADLRGASFETARLYGARFHRAKLQGANFSGARMWRVRFGSAEVDGADFTGAFIELSKLPSGGGYTCPDGRPAHEEHGCFGKEGTTVEGDVRDVVVLVSGTGPSCPEAGARSVTDVSQERYLKVWGWEVVLLYDGGVSMPWGDVDVDGNRWTVDLPGCEGLVLEVGPSPLDGATLYGAGAPSDLGGRSLGAFDFRGHELKDISFEGSRLTGTRFDDADLRGANFRQSTFSDTVSFAGADLRGADFTGAATDPHTWIAVEPAALAGATCPDGRPALPTTGCTERRGTLRLDPVPTTVTILETEYDECALDDWLVVSPHSLSIGSEVYVPLHDGRLLSVSGELKIQEDGTWVVESDTCGRSRIRPGGMRPLAEALTP